jgi:threonine dehydrogenase-like Zn-dependent dehydrogenase
MQPRQSGRTPVQSREKAVTAREVMASRTGNRIYLRKSETASATVGRLCDRFAMATARRSPESCRKQHGLRLQITSPTTQATDFLTAMTLHSTPHRTARALWYVGDRRAELRDEPLRALAPGDALVRMLWSGISRGTERLIFQALVPSSEYERMQGPNMGGAFPHPVKYGYQAVGVVEAGPTELIGHNVFALHPHQERFVLPARELTLLPDALPPRRATLSANVETALNAIWDSGAGPGDRIAIIGGGVVGCLIAAIAGRLPGADVTLVDPVVARAGIAAKLGVGFTAPDAAPVDCDIVFHASAAAKGLATALDCAGFEGTVVEVSWYGDKPVEAPLGRTFHSRRLKLISSQVGHVATSRRARWDHARRVGKVLELLDDARLDALIGQEIAFSDAPALLPAAFADDAAGIAPVLRY